MFQQFLSLKRSLAKAGNSRMVPAEGIEPPTFGLQNRCSTAELSRRRRGTGAGPGMPVRWRGRTLGSLNLLHEARWYGEDDVAACLPFAQLTLPALLPPADL